MLSKEIKSVNDLRFILSKLYNILPENFEGVRRRFALKKQDTEDKYRLISLKAIFSSSKFERKNTWVYNGGLFVFSEDFISSENFLSHLENMRIEEKEKTIQLGDFEVIFQGQSYLSGWRRTRDYNIVSTWPEWQFSINDSGSLNFNSESLVSAEFPCFPIVEDAIDSFVWDRKNSFSSFSRGYNIYLPDIRGKISRYSWISNILNVEIETNIENAILSCAFKKNDGGYEHSFINGSSIQVPENVNSIHLFLVLPPSELLDEKEINSMGKEILMDEERLLLEQVEVDLAGGEREDVEFKPFVEQSNAKFNEIIETIVAFSNTLGGRLYLGVQDSGVPYNEAFLRRASQNNVKEALRLQIELVEKQVREKIKPIPSVQFQEVEVFGENIVVVTVEKGDQTPYSTHENDIFVRKGSSNRKPDVHKELPELYQKNANKASRVVLF